MCQGVHAGIHDVKTSIEKSGTSYRSEILMCQCKLGHSSKDSLVMKSWHSTRTVYMAVYISVWRRRIVTSVEPARGHIDTSLSDIAKSCNGLHLRHLRCADKQLSWLDPEIAVNMCEFCDMTVILIVSIWEGGLLKLLGRAVGTHCKLQKKCCCVLGIVSFDGRH